LGLNYINNVFASFGLNDTILQRRIMDFSARSDGVENYISCRDLVYLFDNIYRGQLINKNYSELMLSLLLQQKVNDRIPRFLPKDVKVAHKTGLERTVVGDAGIVFAGNCDYSLCVLTSKFRSYSQAKKFIAQISKDVYKFITENTINNK
jgi:beta-lactamase class A